MATIIYPGIPKWVTVTVLSGQLSGATLHYMGTTPRCTAPNPNVEDGARARASADETLVTVTCDVPVSQNVNFDVMVMV